MKPCKIPPGYVVGLQQWAEEVSQRTTVACEAIELPGRYPCGVVTIGDRPRSEACLAWSVDMGAEKSTSGRVYLRPQVNAWTLMLRPWGAAPQDPMTLEESLVWLDRQVAKVQKERVETVREHAGQFPEEERTLREDYLLYAEEPAVSALTAYYRQAPKALDGQIVPVSEAMVRTAKEHHPELYEAVLSRGGVMSLVRDQPSWHPSLTGVKLTEALFLERGSRREAGGWWQGVTSYARGLEQAGASADARDLWGKVLPKVVRLAVPGRKEFARDVTLLLLEECPEEHRAGVLLHLGKSWKGDWGPFLTLEEDRKAYQDGAQRQEAARVRSRQAQKAMGRVYDVLWNRSPEDVPAKVRSYRDSLDEIWPYLLKFAATRVMPEHIAKLGEIRPIPETTTHTLLYHAIMKGNMDGALAAVRMGAKLRRIEKSVMVGVQHLPVQKPRFPGDWSQGSALEVVKALREMDTMTKEIQGDMSEEAPMEIELDLV